MKFFYFTLSIFISLQMAAQVNLSNGLSACYALNGNGSEPVNNLNATLTGVTPAVDRFNNASSALAFAGTNLSYVELPDDPFLKSTNAISFGGWIKTNALAKQYVIYSKSPGNFNFEAYALAIFQGSGSSVFRTQKANSGSTVIADGTTNISTNTWYHVYATVDNNSINLYVNGVLEKTMPVAYAFDYEAGKKVILGGSNEPAFNLPFNGSLDNIKFYNRMLNGTEIALLYNQASECLKDQTVGITKTVNDNLFSVFPNPGAGIFNLEFPGTGSGELLVVNTLSQEIHRQKFAVEDQIKIDLQGQPAGIYFVQINMDGQKIVKKIIRQ